MEKRFEEAKFIRKTIKYPAYQTTSRFHNLYSDIRTWVRELIQNADDSEASEISFKIRTEEIEVINNGRTFNSEDVERLLTPSKGGKAIELTGALNLGALSVLTITDQPWYHSGHKILKFEMDHDREDFVPFIDENYPAYFEGTKITLPLHSRLSEEDKEKLRRIDDYLIEHSHLLFTANLSKIKVDYDDRKLYLTKEILEAVEYDGNIIPYIVLDVKIEQVMIKNKKKERNIIKWLIGKRQVKIPKKFFNKKEILKHQSDIVFPFYVAFHIKDELLIRINYPIYITFPSDTPLGLGFTISSNFRPDTSRKGFATDGLDGQFNRYLLRKGSELVIKMLEYFNEKISSKTGKKRQTSFTSLLRTLYFSETQSPLESYVKNYIYQPIIKFLEKNLLDHEGRWVNATEVLMTQKEFLNFLEFKSYFIELPDNHEIKDLLSDIGVIDYTTRDLINDIVKRNIKSIEKLIDSWNYLINQPEELNPREVAKYLMDFTSNNALKYDKTNLVKLLDKIYYYLGNSDNFSKLSLKLKERIKNEAIIYVPDTYNFQNAQKIVYYSKDARKIYGKNRYYIRNKDYPNSLSFFREIGIKTSIKTDNLAEYLIEYVNNYEIKLDYLIILYKILGERFQYISKNRLEELRGAKIILASDYESFSTPDKIYIADDTILLEKFSDIRTTIIDKNVMEFFEKIGVKRISEVIKKSVLFNGIITENDFTSRIIQVIREIIPYLETIAKDINLKLENSWKSRLYGVKCLTCEQIFYILRFHKEQVKIHGQTVDYDSKKRVIGIKKKINQVNPDKFYLDLSKTIASIIFPQESANRKLIGPLIEKLLRSDDKFETMNDLGFSTLFLEAKGISLPKSTIKISSITEEDEAREIEPGNVYNYYQIDNKVKEVLKRQERLLYRTLTFPASYSHGNRERTPPIPKLNLKKDKQIEYYLQEGLKFKEEKVRLKKFQEVLRFIVECMEGNPDTVTTAVFKAPINAFNFNGQLIFNYLMLTNKKMDEEIPLYLIWLMVVAHELAHNISQGHDKHHSKYMMTFSIRALKDLDKIRAYYERLFKE